MKLSERELIKHVEGMQKGNQDDFARIYAAYLPYAHFVVQNSCGSKTEVEDIVQESFIIAYRTAHQLKNPAAFSAWFSRILITAVSKSYRANKRVSVQDDKFFDKIPETDEDFLPERNYESKELRRQVLHAVNELPGRQRQVILAFYFQRLKITDIAESQQLSEGTVKSTLYNARMSLEKRLAPVVRANTFTLPLGYILRAAFEESAVPSATVDFIWQNIISKANPPTLPALLASHIHLVSIIQITAVVFISAGILTGGISVHRQMREAPLAAETGEIHTLADMLGETDAALLAELCENPDETRDAELKRLLNRHQLAADAECWTPGGRKSAVSYRLIKEDKRLYVIRTYGGYSVSYRFEQSDAPELTPDELAGILGGAL